MVALTKDNMHVHTLLYTCMHFSVYNSVVLCVHTTNRSMKELFKICCERTKVKYTMKVHVHRVQYIIIPFHEMNLCKKSVPL